MVVSFFARPHVIQKHCTYKGVTMRGGSYIGNKRRLLSFIMESLESYGMDLHASNARAVYRVADLFSGTGIVSWALASAPNVRYVWANDAMPCAVAMTRARLSSESLDILKRRFQKYVQTASASCRDGNIARDGVRLFPTFSSGARPLFSARVAQMLDALNDAIPSCDHAGRGAFIEVVLRKSNGYGKLSSAKRRQDMAPRCKSRLTSLDPMRPSGTRRSLRTRVTQLDTASLTEKSFPRHILDLVYLDPPYTKHSAYGRYYSLLNTLELGDAPETRGMYHVRAGARPSPFESPRTARSSMHALLVLCSKRARHVALSYGDYGTLSRHDILNMLKKAGFRRVVVYETQTRSYKGDARVTEVLYIAKSVRF